MEPSTTHGPSGLAADVEPPAVLLVETPRFDERDTTACLDLLTASEPAAERLLIVSMTETIGKTHRRWDDHVGEHPEEFAVVSASFADTAPEAGASEAGPAAEEGTNAGTSQELSASPSLETTAENDAEASWLVTHEVGDPGDLTGFGVTISNQLSEWTGDEEQVVLCFRSLTTTLQFVETEELVRFLTELRTHVEAADAIAHFHLDPAAVDERTRAAIRSVADAAVVGEGSGPDVTLLE